VFDPKKSTHYYGTKWQLEMCHVKITLHIIAAKAWQTLFLKKENIFNFLQWLAYT
jgi:hypothetical protein